MQRAQGSLLTHSASPRDTGPGSGEGTVTSHAGSDFLVLVKVENGPGPPNTDLLLLTWSTCHSGTHEKIRTWTRDRPRLKCGGEPRIDQASLMASCVSHFSWTLHLFRVNKRGPCDRSTDPTIYPTSDSLDALN